MTRAPAPPHTLTLRLLGPFEARRGQAPIGEAEWRGHKARHLLQILVLARGRYVPKEQLIEWLWPGAEPRAAEANLRSTVSELRRLLEPGLARGRASAFVLTQHEGYRFSPEAPAQVDVLAFEAGAQAAGRAELEAALARYRGDLLEDEPFAEWALAERERLRRLAAEAHARLAEACLAEADAQAAVAAAERGLALDPGRETLWRALMQAHFQAGDRAAALRAFDRCRAALARDLGADPMPETLALHSAILRAGEAAAAPPAPLPAAGARRPAWLFRLGAAGLLLWVALTAAQLALSLAGVFSGAFAGAGDPGAEALPLLVAQPQGLGQARLALYLLFPLGLLLLPAYAAWFAALRPAAPAAWLGLSLGGLDVLAQTLSRALSAAQVTVLPAAYAGAEAAQRQVLVTLWDVLRQLAGAFGTVSVLAHPLAVMLLAAATLHAGRGGGRPPLPGGRLLAGTGLALAAASLAYTFVDPPTAVAALWLPLGALLAAATYAWLLGWAAALWAAAKSAPRA